MGRSKEDGRRKRVEHTHVSQADRKRNGDVASTHVYIYANRSCIYALDANLEYTHLHIYIHMGNGYHCSLRINYNSRDNIFGPH